MKTAERGSSVLHAGRREMLDHILASRALYGRFRKIDLHNDGLIDEAIAGAGTRAFAPSSRARIVAEFDWNEVPN
jgi:hypothetical protein